MIITADDKEVLYSDLFPNTKQLANELTSASNNDSTQCYALSLFDAIKPHFKLINCYKQFPKSFICEKPETYNITTQQVLNEIPRYGLMKCSDGEYISTLHICDGHDDCTDGIDELNRFCFQNGKTIKDNIYCSRNC